MPVLNTLGQILVQAAVQAASDPKCQSQGSPARWIAAPNSTAARARHRARHARRAGAGRLGIASAGRVFTHDAVAAVVLGGVGSRFDHKALCAIAAGGYWRRAGLALAVAPAG